MAQVELILLTRESMEWNREELREKEIQVTQLLGNYAVAVLEESLVEEFLQSPDILYAELPVRVYTSVELGRAASCISNRPTAPYVPSNLSGKGVLVGIIDSGIDYTHPDFCNEDGTTRIMALWDQSSSFGTPPEGYQLGTLFSKEQIDLALQEEQVSDQRRIVPEVDLSGHGTHVAGIACGNGRASNGKYRGVAYESELVVVKLAEVRSERIEVSGTASLMEAIDFCIRFAMERNQPLALNLSYGTNEGAHNGKSLLETYINTVIRMAKCVICVGTGNEGVGRKHAGGRLENGETVELELAIEGTEKSLQLELWKNYPDEFLVEIESPSGMTVSFPFGEGERVTAFGSSFLYSAWGKTVRLREAELEGFWSSPTIYQNLAEFRLSITAFGERLGVGIWKIRLISEQIVKGEYDIWILRGIESSQSGFIISSPFRTLTIPSTAENVISVGAYDVGNFQVAPFSGRGEARELGRTKPDIVAPGVDIMSCAVGGRYTQKTGTSMATPFVTGGSALLMQWGIVDGNDPFLYGEKLREYLLKGAQRLPAENYPNAIAGWGRLCVENSFL